MNAPLFLFVWTAALSAITIASRASRRASALVSAGGSALLGFFALSGLLDTPMQLLGFPVKFATTWVVLGRAFVLNAGNRAPIGFLFLIGAFLFAGGAVTRAPRTYFPVGLGLIALVAGSLMIQPFVFAPIFLAFAAMGSTLILVTQGHAARRGALRLVSLYLMAMGAILVAGWLLDVRGVTSGSPELASRVTLLLGLGFAILMAVPPFHIWLPASAQEAHPYALAFVAVILQSAGLFFLLQFLNTYEWLRLSSSVFSAMRWAGIGVLLFGTAWALAQRTLTRMVAYALLADLGVMLLAVGIGTGATYRLALGLSGARVVSLGVWALGESLLEGEGGAADEEALAGAGRRHPEAALAAMVGLVSLGGLPLTAGFPGRWGLLAAVAADNWLFGAVLLAGIAGIGLAAARWILVLSQQAGAPAGEGRGIATRAAVLGGVALCLLLGVFPQLTYPWVVQAAAGLSNLVP